MSIKTLYPAGCIMPSNNQTIVESLEKHINNQPFSWESLDAFRDPHTVSGQVRSSTYLPKHVRDLKDQMKRIGQQVPIIAEEQIDESGNRTLVIIEGNNRFKAIQELYEENPNWNKGCDEAVPSIKVSVLQQGFFPNEATKKLFQVYANRPVLKQSLTPADIYERVGEVIDSDGFGNTATIPSAQVASAASDFVRSNFPTQSGRSVQENIDAMVNKATKSRTLVNGFTSRDAQNHRAASNVSFDGMERGKEVIAPQTVRPSRTTLYKALGEIIVKMNASSASGHVVRVVSKTDKLTDADINEYRKEVDNFWKDVNVGWKNATGVNLVKEVLHLPEKSTEQKLHSLKRFVKTTL